MHALIVVDLHEEFEVPKTLVQKIERRSADFPLRVFTQFVNQPNSLFRTKLKRDMGTPGAPGFNLLIQPGPGDLLLHKSGYGLTPGHIAALRARQVTEATIAGVDTDACVLGVMFSLWDNGIDCHLDRELCWSSADLHKEAVKIAEQQFGR